MSHRPIFFCHIPKTGGTTLRYAIEAAFKPFEIVPDNYQIARNRGKYSPIGLVIATLSASVIPIRLVRGHYHFSLHELLDDPVKIVVLREPVARSISLFKHMIAHGGRPQETILSALEAGRFPAPDNQMTRFLGGSLKGIGGNPGKRHEELMAKPIRDEQKMLAEAKMALKNTDILGLTERLDLIVEPLEKLGTKFPDQRLNIAAIPDLRLTGKQIKTIREHNALDLALYEAARELLGVDKESPTEEPTSTSHNTAQPPSRAGDAEVNCA